MPTTTDQFLSISDVCIRYGVSKHTVYGWTSGRQIPHLRIGKHLRFRLSDLEQWEAERAVGAKR